MTPFDPINWDDLSRTQIDLLRPKFAELESFLKNVLMDCTGTSQASNKVLEAFQWALHAVREEQLQRTGPRTPSRKVGHNRPSR